METTQTQQYVLKAEHLSKAYACRKTNRTIQAVTDVSLKLPAGGLLSILGASGCGKSTVLKILAGLVQPDEGTVSLNGEQIATANNKLVPGHPEIKLVHQDFQLHDHMTVRENIRHELLKFTDAWQDTRLKELIEVAVLDGITEQMPSELSGGQQQRVALAMALASGPKVVLLDEPFSNLDAFLRQQISTQIIERLKLMGVSMVMVTHESKDALSLSSAVAVMKEGTFLQVGEPREVYHKPNSAYVAAFFGEANIMPNAFVSALPSGIKSDVLAALGGSLAEGSAMCMRPEAVKQASPEQPFFNAEVRKVRFMGSHWQIEAVYDNSFRFTFYADERLEQAKVYPLTILPHKLHAF